MFTQKWGDSYYGHNIGPDADSPSAGHWIEQLEHYQPNLKQRVQRTVNQWNLIVRDQLRNETALRLSIEKENKINHPEHKPTQIPIKVVDGLPEPLIDILRRYSEQAPILLNENAFTDTVKGLRIANNQFSALQTLCPSQISQSDLANASVWLQQILEQLRQIGIRGVAIFAKACLGHPSPNKRQKLRDRLCLRRPRFVRVTSFRPNKGSKHWLSHDLTPFRDALIGSEEAEASVCPQNRAYGSVHGSSRKTHPLRNIKPMR